MHLILNDGSVIPSSTKSKRIILMKAALVCKPHWGSRKKKVVACGQEFIVSEIDTSVNEYMDRWHRHVLSKGRNEKE